MLAERTTIYLGSIPLEVFMLPDSQYVLSQTQVAEAVGKTKVSFGDFLVSKSPEALPYKGFRSKRTSIKGNNVQINIIPIDLAVAYWIKEAITGNATAARLLGACAAESIERRADSAFGVQRAEEERQEFMRIRLEGKRIRRRLTDAIKSYIDRHPELSENNRKWLYVNASQRVTLVVFGRKAKKLAEDLGVHPDNLRDALTPDELILLQEVEDTAVRLIDIQDIHPDDAIQQTAERLLIQVQNRALKLK
jgi:hypothetical protein